MPEPILQRLNAELNKALNIPEVKQTRGQRLSRGRRFGRGFGKRIRDDIAFYGPIFKSVGVQAQ